jgi:hypothetical protein
MASSGEIVERIAEVAEVLPSTVDRGLRPLRDAGLVPMGVAGRGKTHGQYDHTHVNNVVLGLGADLPAGAATAATLLRATYCEAIPAPDEQDPLWSWMLKFTPPLTLDDYDQSDDGERRISAGTWLDHLTLALARMTQQERFQFRELCEAQEAELALGLAPVAVTLLWNGPLRQNEVRFSDINTPLRELFPSGDVRAPRRRVTFFPLAIFAVAGELAADTLSRVRPALDFPPSGSTPENEEAPVLPGTSASKSA